MSKLLAALQAAGRKNVRAASDTEEDDPKAVSGAEPEAEADEEEPEAAAEDEPDGDEDEDEPDGDEPEGEGDDEDEKMHAKGFKAGFAAANKRALAILTAPEAEANANLAVKLAFDPAFTGMSAKKACALLKESGSGDKATGKSGLAERMAGRKGNALGPDGKNAGATGSKGDGALLASAQSRFARSASGNNR